MAEIPVAVQMYTLRDDLNRDFAGVVAQVAQIGYEAVELAGYHGHTAEEVKRICDDNGLSVYSTHVGIEQARGETQRVIDEHLMFGAKYMVIPYIGEDWRKSHSDYQRLAAILSEVGGTLAMQGITLCYHNHAFEFDTFDGQTGFDILFGNADPDLVKVEMDTFWVKKGGQDIVATLQKYQGRVPLVHLKDMTPDGDFAPVGTGTIDYSTLIPAARDAGAEVFIVEQDVCKADTPINSVRTSFENLKKMGVA